MAYGSFAYIRKNGAKEYYSPPTMDEYRKLFMNCYNEGRYFNVSNYCTSERLFIIAKNIIMRLNLSINGKMNSLCLPPNFLLYFRYCYTKSPSHNYLPRKSACTVCSEVIANHAVSCRCTVHFNCRCYL